MSGIKICHYTPLDGDCSIREYQSFVTYIHKCTTQRLMCFSYFLLSGHYTFSDPSCLKLYRHNRWASANYIASYLWFFITHLWPNLYLFSDLARKECTSVEDACEHVNKSNHKARFFFLATCNTVTIRPYRLQPTLIHRSSSY